MGLVWFCVARFGEEGFGKLWHGLLRFIKREGKSMVIKWIKH